VFTTLHRLPVIAEQSERIEKYITGIVNNRDSKMYAIYAKPEHIHFLASRSPEISDELLASIVEESSANTIHENGLIQGKISMARYLFSIFCVKI
jgi:putative transposase